MGFSLEGCELTKLTLAPKSFGYTGRELSEILLSNNIVCESSDEDFLVMMFSPDTSARDFARIKSVFSGISQRRAIDTLAPAIMPSKVRISPHDALFSSKEKVRVENSLGRTFAGAALSCPPAIPICIYGEEIDDAQIACMKYYGITECEVVK